MKKLKVFGTSILVLLLCAFTSCTLIKYSIDPVGAVKPARTSSTSHFNPSLIRRVAILVEESHLAPSRLVEDEFVSELLKKGYTVPSRSDLKQLMQELRFQHSDITDASAAKIGKMLNAHAVLVIHMISHDIGSGEHISMLKVTISARLLNVEKGEILWIGSSSGKGREDRAGDIFIEVAREICAAFPAR